MNPQEICNFECYAGNKNELINELENGNFNRIKEPLLYMRDHSNLFYAPVGNYPKNPIVIICGKTTSKDSRDLFIQNLDNKKDFYTACFKSIYSNMKYNLAIYLNEIGLFRYLKEVDEYWSDANTDVELVIRFLKIFNNKRAAMNSRIQMTQAINCAILTNNTANQPSKKIVDKFLKESNNCIFKSFKNLKRTKLIIFLDSPSESGFHQENYFVKRMPDYMDKVVSITHPGGQNNVVFKYLSRRKWEKVGTKGLKAEKLFKKAEKKIQKLIENSNK